MVHLKTPALGEDAKVGLVGEFLATVSPHTEASEAALLVDFLCAFGNAVGMGPHFRLNGSVVHRPCLFVVVVGVTSKARKGTGRANVSHAMAIADPPWASACIKNGHASGEGIIAQLVEQQAIDPRLLIEEEEFASLLRKAGREGAVISEVLRNAWDLKRLANRRSKDAVEIGPRRYHLSVIGNITREELDATLRKTDAANGFANRFLWVHAERSKVLPFGGDMTEDDWKAIGTAIRKALSGARKIGTMRFSGDARGVWAEWYRSRPENTPGILGLATSRDEAYVLRLSMVYALMDGRSAIDVCHINAAIAVWDYCFDSARVIFGDRTGDTDVDKLVDHLRAVGHRGMSRSQQLNLFGRRGRKAAEARERVMQLGIAVELPNVETGGRPEHSLFLNEHAPIVGASHE